MALSWQEWTVICIALGAGGLTKGLTGMGLPMVAIPIMAAYLGVERAVLLMIVPTVVLNVWQSFTYRDCIDDMPEMWRLLLPGVPGAALGASVLYLTPDHWLATVLALWISSYLVFRLVHSDFSLSIRARRQLAPAAGFGAGAMQAATGICAPVIAPYLDSLGLTSRSYVFAISTSFAAFAGSHFFVLLILQAYSIQQILESSIALIPGLLAMRPGMWLREIVAPRVFTIVIRTILAVMAVRLIYGAWFSA